ncbi:MAG: Stp1/IreP family PP2C-type Ser/Thr phosphatase [Coriobacteriia bacterium]|nr:Stp1/IreP family PP2C-type Ser/Thr phosphatase [Coriobacteriia bacterium]
MAAKRSATSFFGSRTHVGCIRDHNEDSLVVAPPLFAVADGMGGHAAGEVASEIAIQVLSEQAPKHPNAEALGRAVESANQEIITAAAQGRGRAGMGTTVTAAMLEDERLVIAQVGDSRAYLLHNGKLQQLTRDHSLMADMIDAGQITPEEARFHPNRSIITRALGSNPHTRPDLFELNVHTGDRLLLCSDGLTTMLEDDQIEQVMNHATDPQRCAAQLVNDAVAAGGYDNVTVVVVDVTGFAEQRVSRIARKTKVMVGIILALLAVIIGVAGYALTYWTSTAAYLHDVDGKVAIYQGVPGEFAGIQFSHVDHVTDVKTKSLSPTTADRLRNDGISADNLEHAQQLLDQYVAEAAVHTDGTPTGGDDAQLGSKTTDTKKAKSKKDEKAAASKSTKSAEKAD